MSPQRSSCTTVHTNSTNQEDPNTPNAHDLLTRSKRGGKFITVAAVNRTDRHKNTKSAPRRAIDRARPRRIHIPENLAAAVRPMLSERTGRVPACQREQ